MSTANSGDNSDSPEEDTICGSCKRGLSKENTLVCVLCDGTFHRSCIKRLKNTKQLTHDKVICCANKVDSETALCCIVGMVKDIECQKNELTLMKELLHEMREKNKLLEEKLSNIEKPIIKYSDVAKFKPTVAINPDIHDHNTAAIILAPKNPQNSEKTKKDLQNSIKPAELKISIKSIRPTRNGGLAINCTSANDANTLLSEIQNKLDDTYKAKLSQLVNPKIKIVGYQPERDEDPNTLAQKIINQNNLKTQNETFNITYISKNKNKKSIIFAETTPELFKIIMNRGKLCIDWERFPIYEDIAVTRCHKCQSYNHKQNRCTNCIACCYCSGNHDSKDCPKTSRKCINCVNANDKYQLKHNIHHEANDPQCPTYLFHLKRQRARVNYGE